MNNVRPWRELVNVRTRERDDAIRLLQQAHIQITAALALIRYSPPDDPVVVLHAIEDVLSPTDFGAFA